MEDEAVFRNAASRVGATTASHMKGGLTRMIMGSLLAPLVNAVFGEGAPRAVKMLSRWAEKLDRYRPQINALADQFGRMAEAATLFMAEHQDTIDRAVDVVSTAVTKAGELLVGFIRWITPVLRIVARWVGKLLARLIVLAIKTILATAATAPAGGTGGAAVLVEGIGAGVASDAVALGFTLAGTGGTSIAKKAIGLVPKAVGVAKDSLSEQIFKSGGRMEVLLDRAADVLLESALGDGGMLTPPERLDAGESMPAWNVRHLNDFTQELRDRCNGPMLD